MGLVLGHTKTVDLPAPDDGQTVVIRKLSYRKMQAAAAAQQEKGIGFMKSLGAELMTALRDADADKLEKLEKVQAATVSSYDRDTLLEKGIVSWSFDPALDDSNRTEVIGELDEPTAQFIAEAIFEYSRPPSEAEAKKKRKRSSTT
jgi:hypothetical protein